MEILPYFYLHFDAPDIKCNKFLDLASSSGFSRQIFDNTRRTSCIDNIFVNFQNSLTYTINTFNPVLSDHHAVTISIEFTTNNIHQPNSKTGL